MQLFDKIILDNYSREINYVVIRNKFETWYKRKYRNTF